MNHVNWVILSNFANRWERGIRRLKNWVSLNYGKNRNSNQNSNCLVKTEGNLTFDFQNLIWHINSTYFSDEKTSLASIFGLKLMELQTLVFSPSEAPRSTVLQNWKKLFSFHERVPKGQPYFGWLAWKFFWAELLCTANMYSQTAVEV